MKMRSEDYMLLLLWLSAAFRQLTLGQAADADRFNYRSTNGNDYGPTDWSQVTCNEVGECPGWPDGWESAVGWQLNTNKCDWCPESGDRTCGLHRQSPINLLREDSTTGHDSECYDYHWMAYEDRSCRWSDIIDNPNTPERNNFQIRRHSLQILQPVNDAGELQCRRNDGQNSFPRLDYSKGFPNWWHLSHTEITVPSEHHQEGKQYDAEVHLAHFYEIDHERQMGIVAIFLEANPDRNRWPFLDKLICQWREVEDKTREECGLPSVSADYPGCRNPNREGGGGGGGSNPTSPPEASPTPAPEAPPMPGPVSPPTTIEAPSTPEFIDTPPTTGSIGNNDAFACSDFIGIVNMDRICRDGGCCGNPRSDVNFCHSTYSLFGDNMAQVCSDCCNPSKEIGPPPPQHPVYPPIDCTTVDNPFRMCKPNSCCETTPSISPYCGRMYDTHGDDMSSVCWYCCSEPKDIGAAGPVLAEDPTPTSPPGDTPTLPPVTFIPVPKPTDLPLTPSPFTATLNPVALPTGSGEMGVVCADYIGHPTINMDRICKAGGCCDPTRSSTDHCHSVYEFFGEDMSSVCSDCCNPTKTLAPPPPAHPTYPPIQCSLVDNPFRMCKPKSCCDPAASLSPYCQGVYDTYGGDMGSICWYCCSEPKEVDPTLFSDSRNLLEQGNGRTDEDEEVMRRDVRLPHGFYASEVKLHPSDLEVTEGLEEEYLAGIEQYRDLRELEEDTAQDENSRRLNSDNYEDVRYSPYQWMREIKTEYYFRYEGGQMVPPCFEVVHYRVMKDPIQIHPTQLAELERLLAWRIAPRGSEFNECENDTAGRPRAGSNGNAVDLNRPLQAYSNIHRKVFCECKDWTSKFQEDIDWCQMNENQRWYDEPYNFDSGGDF